MPYRAVASGPASSCSSAAKYYQKSAQRQRRVGRRRAHVSARTPKSPAAWTSPGSAVDPDLSYNQTQAQRQLSAESCCWVWKAAGALMPRQHVSSWPKAFSLPGKTPGHVRSLALPHHPAADCLKPTLCPARRRPPPKTVQAASHRCLFERHCNFFAGNSLCVGHVQPACSSFVGLECPTQASSQNRSGVLHSAAARFVTFTSSDEGDASSWGGLAAPEEDPGV